MFHRTSRNTAAEKFHPYQKLILWLGLLIIMVAGNWAIYQKESILSEGQSVLLPLLPRDPRSLLQGDYMQLRLQLSQDIAYQLKQGGESALQAEDGFVAITIDEQNVGQFSGLVTKEHAASLEQPFLRYRKRGDNYGIASDAFFFEEGAGAYFAQARYAEVKFNRHGDALITHLYDSGLQRLSEHDSAR
jgi:uncharacterized membrane-anchored protein